MRVKWWSWLGAFALCLAMGAACEYPQWALEHNRDQAEYVEQFGGSMEIVERAVRQGLTEEGFEIAGTGEPEEGPERIIRARKGPIGETTTIQVSVLVEPAGEDGQATTIYLNAQRQEGGIVDTVPIVAAIERAIENKGVAVARTETPSTTAPSDDSEATGGEADTAEGGSADFVEAVPQSSAYALVIGIEQYRDLPKPTGAAADAKRMTDLLRNSFGLPADHIRTLVDDRATHTDLSSALDWIAESVPEGGRIYFYYAGHGAPHPQNGSSLVLPYEASQQNPTGSGLSLDGIMSKLESSGAKSVFAFVDACFSGEGSRSVTAEGQRPTVPVELNKDKKEEGRSVLYAASKAEQISGPNAENTGGLFTDHLVSALGRGSADVDGDGQITVEELDTYVTPRVARQAEALSRKQEPDLKIGPGITDVDNLSITWGLPVD